jgi:WXG100 family type VII secretion target
MERTLVSAEHNTGLCIDDLKLDHNFRESGDLIMPKILIDTESVREAGRRFTADGHSLEEMVRELQTAIDQLDINIWDGRSRAEAEPLLSQIHPESTYLVQTLDELGQKLMRVADSFEREDSMAAGNLSGMSWVDFESAPSSLNPDILRTPLSFAPLGGNAGGNYTTVYANARASGDAYYSSNLENDEYFEEARERVGDQRKRESDEHYEWRIKREIEFLHWAYVEWQPKGMQLPPNVKKILYKKSWQEHYEEWLENNPEPE